MIKKLKSKVPSVHEKSWVAKEAVVIGDVHIKEGANIWFGASIRGDMDHIEIGKNSNVQDNATVHVDAGHPVVVGEGVTIGHNAIVHGCTIEDNVLIGMGATILNGAYIEEGCIIGANALITENKRIEAGSLVIGNPGKVIKQVSEAQKEHIQENAKQYVEEGKQYKDEGY